MQMLDTLLINIISLSLALLLAAAALGKWLHWQEFTESLAGYRLLPQALLPIAGVLIPLLETTLAIGLALQQFPAAAICCSVLLFGYGLAIYINIRRGNLSLDCGCHFGAASQAISMGLVYRNLCLAVAALLLLLPVEGRSLSGFDYTLGALAVSFLALFYGLLNTLILNTTRYTQELT